jgi:hypothetical protein
VAGPLVFRAEDRQYRFEGEVPLERLLSGIVSVPAFVASQGPPTWKQITSLLESFKRLRDATGWAA